MAKTSKTIVEANSQARNDAYTGMLIVSLVALLTGAVFLYLDYSQYPTTKPPAAPKVSPEAPIPPAEGQAPLPKADEPKDKK